MTKPRLTEMNWMVFLAEAGSLCSQDLASIRQGLAQAFAACGPWWRYGWSHSGFEMVVF